MFDLLEDAINDFKNGKPLVIADDEDRENEGDLIIPAQFVTPELINFMTKECRGLICLSITKERADELQLSDMVEQNTDIKKTAFTESVDADQSFGVTTGISAFDRAKTIEVILNKETKPSDLRRPGHIFPLIAKQGGVLQRAGHTEAGIDLCRIAGISEGAVICEILKDDGTMARRDDLFQFAKKHNLKFITVAQIIKHRLKTERYVKRCVQTFLPTKFGEFEIYGYLDEITQVEHVALVKDDKSDKTPMVRVHSECLTGDIFHSLKCDCNQQLHSALKMINSYGKGALVYLRDHEGRGIGLLNKLKAYLLQDRGEDTVDANISLGFPSDLREYGVGAQILLDIGYNKFNLITNNPKKIIALEGYGLEVKERINIEPDINKFNERYIMTKKERMNHLFEGKTKTADI